MCGKGVQPYVGSVGDEIHQFHGSLMRTSGQAVNPSRGAVSVLALSPTASPTALALVLGGLLDGLLGPLLSPGVGAAEVMSASGVGDAGVDDDEVAVSVDFGAGGVEIRPSRRSIAVSCLPLDAFLRE